MNISICVPQIAFNRIAASNETTSAAGGSAVIVCPFVSVPEAVVTWWFANNTQVPRWGSGDPRRIDVDSNRRV